MGRQGYPSEVTTRIPAATPDGVQLAVLRELLAWCRARCSGAYQLTTTERKGQPGTWLSVQFERAEDRTRFEARFARRVGGMTCEG